MSATFRQDPSARSGHAAGTPPDARQFKSFPEFYPFYLSEHSNRVSRRLHFV
ncbi:Mpo1-like protein, partial [Klebsiella pneumoniae]|uniref:Mpo1-like protein n=1 Tax=Klebsiella pneumoniae TaxID=573 RepID=UPI003B9864F6